MLLGTNRDGYIMRITILFVLKIAHDYLDYELFHL